MIDLDITTGKGVVIVAALLAIAVLALAASTTLAIIILALAVGALAYLVYAIGVRINRRIMGRTSRRGGAN